FGEAEDPLAEGSARSFAGGAIAELQVRVGVDQTGQDRDVAEVVIGRVRMFAPELFRASDGGDALADEDDAAFGDRRLRDRRDPRRRQEDFAAAPAHGTSPPSSSERSLATSRAFSSR